MFQLTHAIIPSTMFQLTHEVSLQQYFNLRMQISLQHCFKLSMQVSLQQYVNLRMQTSLQHCFNLQSIFQYIWTIQKLGLSILRVSDSCDILFDRTTLFDDASRDFGLVYCKLTENILGNIHRAKHVKCVKIKF